MKVKCTTVGCFNEQVGLLYGGLCPACAVRAIGAITPGEQPSKTSQAPRKLIKFQSLLPLQPKSHRQYLSDLLADYERTGYLHNPMGVVVKIEHRHTLKSFQRFNLWSALIASLFVLLAVGLTVILPCMCPLWLALVVSAADGIFKVDTDKRHKCRCKWRFLGIAKVVTKETVTVDLGGLFLQVDIPIVPDGACGFPDQWREFKLARRKIDVKVGDKLSKKDGANAQIMLPHQQRAMADKYRNDIVEIDRKAKIAREESEAIRIENEKVRRERELALVKAKAEAQELQRWKNSLRLDNWTPDASEPGLYILPGVWHPFHKVGIGYAYVGAYGSIPPKQVWNKMRGGWDTVGPQEAQRRGIVILGAGVGKSQTYATVLNPLVLPLTSKELVIFVADTDDSLCYVFNPICREEYQAFRDEQMQYMLNLLKPVLKRIYDQAVAGDSHGTGGWM